MLFSYPNEATWWHHHCCGEMLSATHRTMDATDFWRQRRTLKGLCSPQMETFVGTTRAIPTHWALGTQGPGSSWDKRSWGVWPPITLSCFWLEITNVELHGFLCHEGSTSGLPPFQHHIYSHTLRMHQAAPLRIISLWICLTWGLASAAGLDKHRPRFRGAQTATSKSHIKVTFLLLKFQGQENKKISSHITKWQCFVQKTRHKALKQSMGVGRQEQQLPGLEGNSPRTRPSLRTPKPSTSTNVMKTLQGDIKWEKLYTIHSTHPLEARFQV